MTPGLSFTRILDKSSKRREPGAYESLTLVAPNEMWSYSTDLKTARAELEKEEEEK